METLIKCSLKTLKTAIKFSENINKIDEIVNQEIKDQTKVLGGLWEKPKYVYLFDLSEGTILVYEKHDDGEINLFHGKETEVCYSTISEEKDQPLSKLRYIKTKS